MSLSKTSKKAALRASQSVQVSNSSTTFLPRSKSIKKTLLSSQQSISEKLRIRQSNTLFNVSAQFIQQTYNFPIEHEYSIAQVTNKLKIQRRRFNDFINIAEGLNMLERLENCKVKIKDGFVELRDGVQIDEKEMQKEKEKIAIEHIEMKSIIMRFSQMSQINHIITTKFNEIDKSEKIEQMKKKLNLFNQYENIKIQNQQRQQILRQLIEGNICDLCHDIRREKQDEDGWVCSCWCKNMFEDEEMEEYW